MMALLKRGFQEEWFQEGVAGLLESAIRASLDETAVLTYLTVSDDSFM